MRYLWVILVSWGLTVAPIGYNDWSYSGPDKILGDGGGFPKEKPEKKKYGGGHWHYYYGQCPSCLPGPPQKEGRDGI